MGREAYSSAEERTPASRQALEETAARFERAWLAGETPELEDYLNGIEGSERLALFRELLRLEAAALQRRGTVPYLASYLGRFPAQANLVEEVLGPFVQTHHGGRQNSEVQLGVPLPMPETDAKPLPTVLPGYDLIKILGQGGMGIVYLARQQQLKRMVAVKMIRPGPSPSLGLESRFRREAEAIARLQHPHIVQVFEVGNHLGCPYIVLEYVPGENLARHAGGQPQPPRWAGEILSKLADAVQAAHQAGVVHRDLKPANVLLTLDGIPKVTDFGLAKLQDAPDGGREGPTTRNDVVLGTASYMPPEQAPGRTEELGPAADIYSLGAILYELLTGRPPFLGVTFQHTLLMVETVEPMPPRRLNPQVPRDLETICLTCLHKDPARRYATAALLAEDLRRFLRNEPIQARASGVAERAWRWMQRNPGTASLVLLLTIVLVTETVLAWSLSLVATRQAQEAVANARMAGINEKAAHEEARKAQAETLRFAATERLLRRQLYASQINVAALAYQDRDLPHAQSALESLQPRSGVEDLRGFEWHYLWRLSHSELTTRRAHLTAVRGVAWNADGSRFATCGDDLLKIWSTQTGVALRTIKVPKSGVRCLVWSREGNLLVVGGEDGQIRAWDGTSGSELFTLQGHEKAATSLAVSQDGRWLVSGSLDHTVRVWDLGNRSVMHSLTGPTEIQAVALSPDAQELAATGRNGSVRTWSRETGKQLQLFRVDGEPVRAVAYSPDGRWLAVTGSERLALIQNRQSARGLLPLRGHAQEITAMTWTPDSRHLVTASSDQSIRLWEAESLREALVLRGHTAAVTSVAVSADGQRLLSGSEDHTVKVWKSDPDQHGATLRGHEEGVQCLAWSPDGSRLASGGRDRTVRLWDATTHALQRKLEGYQGSIFRVAWSPDGGRLATGSGDKTVRIWDTKTGELVFSMKEHTGSVFGVAWSPTGDRLYTASADKTIRVWNANDGTLAKTIDGHSVEVRSLSLSADGLRLATGSLDGTVQVLDTTTASVVFRVRPQSEAIRDVAISSDGRCLVTGSYDGTVQILDGQTGQVRHSVRENNAPVDAVALSPDGQRFLTGGRDRRLRVWDSHSGLLLLTLSESRSSVLGVAFRPDGKQIGAATEGKAVRLW